MNRHLQESDDPEILKSALTESIATVVNLRQEYTTMKDGIVETLRLLHSILLPLTNDSSEVEHALAILSGLLQNVKLGDQRAWTASLTPEEEAQGVVWIGLVNYLAKQIGWSRKTFGNEKRTIGISKHIMKELKEIQEDPEDILEWIDVVILALDGAWRHGASPEQIAAALISKQKINFSRTYPFSASADKPSEHDRENDPKRTKKRRTRRKRTSSASQVQDKTE